MQLFLLAPWLAATLYSTAVSAGSINLVPRQYGGYNITEDVQGVAGAISQPTCNATQPCIQLVTVVIPRCLKLRGDAGCWCGNHDPVHYCALCMSNPTDNSTTPDQTQAATNFHARFHGGCAAFESYINGTTPTTSASASSATPTVSVVATQNSSNSGSNSKSSNTGAIIGGTVGGLVGLALIGAICFLSYQLIKRKADPNAVRPMSMMTSPELKYTPSPPPLHLPASATQPPQGYGQFPMQQGQPGTMQQGPQGNNMATYGSPMPYNGSPPAALNPQRDNNYDTRML